MKRDVNILSTGSKHINKFYSALSACKLSSKFDITIESFFGFNNYSDPNRDSNFTF